MFHKEYMKLRDWIDVSQLYWNRLSGNPNAISLIERELIANPNSKKIDWFWMRKNPNAVHLLELQPDTRLSLPDTRLSLPALAFEKIDWSGLSVNPNAIHLLEAHPVININDWNPNTLEEKIKLSSDPNAIYLLEANPEKISWYYFSANPAIFTYDYSLIKQEHSKLTRDIIEYVNSPQRMQRWLQNEKNTIEDFEYLYG